jgi:hypothetical protein
MASEGAVPVVIDFMKNPENDIIARQVIQLRFLCSILLISFA